MCAQLLSTQPYKGTRDFYPEEMRLRNWFFGKIRESLEVAAFEEYNGPMLESLELYAAKSGEEIAEDKLSKVSKSEEFLLNLGFSDFRVRLSGNDARLELRRADAERFLREKENILKKCKTINKM